MGLGLFNGGLFGGRPAGTGAGSRILDLCDCVVAQVHAAWLPTAPDGVARAYAPRVGLTGDQPDTLLEGRRVFVFPASYGSPGLAQRDELWRTHQVSVLVVERYTADPGPPPDTWVDARVEFVERNVFGLLRNPALVLSGGTIAAAFPPPDEGAEVGSVYDENVLLQYKTFWSYAAFTFQELTTLDGDTP